MPISNFIDVTAKKGFFVLLTLIFAVFTNASDEIYPDYSNLAKTASKEKSTVKTEDYLELYKSKYKSSANESLGEGFAILYKAKADYVLKWLSQQSSEERAEIISSSKFGFENVYGEATLLKPPFSQLFDLNIKTLNVSEHLINKPNNKAFGLVVIAPGKKYLMRERLFSRLAEKLSKKGYVVVRFNWSKSTLTDEKLELQKASEDIKNVTEYFQNKFKFKSDKTILISKSFSTKALDLSIQLAKTHVLLTPNCSVEAPFEKTYNRILMNFDVLTHVIISNEDPYCDVRQIYRTLEQAKVLPRIMTTKGDHNFVLNQSDFRHQDQVINYVVDSF